MCELMGVEGKDPWRSTSKEDSEIDKFAYIGRLVFDAADLEFELDNYIFKLSKDFPRLVPVIGEHLGLKKSQLKQYSFSTSEKIGFLIGSFVFYPPLRRLGDISGNLDLNGIGYTLEEFFDLRNHVVHGSV